MTHTDKTSFCQVGHILVRTIQHAVGSVEPVDAGGLAAQDAGTRKSQGRDETDGADSDPLHHSR